MQTINQTAINITNDHGEPHTHVFTLDTISALNAALAINRPLLIRGEPGIGKSQLAKAAAVALKRTYIPFVVNATTEAQDLLWSFDAIARLADAQIEGALCRNEDAAKEVRKKLALQRYIKPAPLWTALNWQLAEAQYNLTHNKEASPLPHYLNAEHAQTNGVVVLIDEIDNADSSVPNGLLEVLGANRFHPDGLEKAIEADADGIQPLIIITTNEERVLPDAFIRRCLSITLNLPTQQAEQIAYLVKNAMPNFPNLEADILQAAAKMVVEDRAEADKNNLHPLPGQAEYFDLLRGINAQKGELNDDELQELIETLAQFTSKKHPDYEKK
jgi:MoxR-like ATPase